MSSVNISIVLIVIFILLADTTRLLRTRQFRTTGFQHQLGHGHRTDVGRSPAPDATAQQVHVCDHFHITFYMCRLNEVRFD